MKKKSKILLALILVIVLFTSVLTPVASAFPYNTAVITKMLKVAVGTTLPTTGSFQYVITPVSINNQTTLTPPSIPNVTILMPSVQGACECATPCAADVVHYYRESTQFFNSVVWPSAGIFEYRISETPNTITGLPVGENMNYSQAVYRVRVHVRRNAAGQLYIHIIAAYRDINDAGVTLTPPVKVDPTPGGNGTTYRNSQMAFQNIYTKHTGGGGTDPVNRYTLGVQKLVTGDYGNTNQYFNFTMTVTRPSLITEPTTVYKAYVVEGTATAGLPSLADNNLPPGGSDVGGAYANITSGVEFTFRLRHNQRLSFTNTHVGSSYAVSETGVEDYIPSVVVTTNSVPGPIMTGTASQGLAIPTTGSVYPTRPLVGEGNSANRAVFTNSLDFVEELGLNINDLPFYGLIFLALAGIVALTITKARSRKKYY